MIATVVGGTFAAKAKIWDCRELFFGQDRTTTLFMDAVMMFLLDRQSLPHRLSPVERGIYCIVVKCALSETG
jgi:hypothetical protein